MSDAGARERAALVHEPEKELRRAGDREACMVAEDLRRIQEDLRLASEQARQSAEDARQAAADLRIALDHALKAAAEQLITMQQLRESLARSRDATWD